MAAPLATGFFRCRRWIRDVGGDVAGEHAGHELVPLGGLRIGPCDGGVQLPWPSWRGPRLGLAPHQPRALEQVQVAAHGVDVQAHRSGQLDHVEGPGRLLQRREEGHSAVMGQRTLARNLISSWRHRRLTLPEVQARSCL